MVLSGRLLWAVLILLFAWLGFLCRTLWKRIKETPTDRPRKAQNYLTIAGIVSSIVAVGALLGLHLSWISVEISQHLGIASIRILFFLLLWPTLAGLFLCLSGTGAARWFGVGTCLATALWWMTLSFGAAISMGAPPIARHPTKFLVPQGYIGWIKIKHGDGGLPLPISNGAFVCRIPANGVLQTSSPREDGWAKDEYFYYSADGSLRALAETGWGEGGMIWAGGTEWQATDNGSKPTQFTEKFYVGREDQYHNNESKPSELLGSSSKERP
jgi:hypothetical protein